MCASGLLGLYVSVCEGGCCTFMIKHLGISYYMSHDMCTAQISV